MLELDDDLRLTEHCPKLAAMLLRGGSSTQGAFNIIFVTPDVSFCLIIDFPFDACGSMAWQQPGRPFQHVFCSPSLETDQGLRFSEFVARDEAARAEEILRGSSSVAQAFHTHLVDSCASKFRTEVFQVTYQVPSGQHRHLIGLRDFTDLQSLAGNKAADAIHDVDRELELYDGLSSLRGHSESVPEAGIHPPASSSVESNMDGSHGRRIVEQAVALQGKNMFLDIDCQAMQVCAASAPLTSLIGRGLSEVFVYNYTLELCMRLWHQAKQSQDLPDNMVSFERMPLFCLPRTIDISGIMQLSRTSLGDLHVILNFRPSAFVQL